MRAFVTLLLLALAGCAPATPVTEPSGGSMLFTGIHVHVPAGTTTTDVAVAGGRVTASGVAGEVIDGSGLAMIAIVPAPDGRGHVVGAVEPGIPADLLVVPRRVMPRPGTPWWRVIISRGDVRALVSRGRIVVRDGEPLDRPANPDGERVGVWVDRADWLHQELLPEGRYDETRGGRQHAYTGRYWLDGDRIDYLDDSGFYAFGDFIRDELYHAEFVMRLRQP
ncbi:Atu4866 domain-containing protein [Actinoplanes missouriensis]|uniref:Atu4866 domain-containing protein n=1 Tax=Actinoplanes missouriensis TaxID=1866 RepID=UPI0033EE9B91